MRSSCRSSSTSKTNCCSPSPPGTPRPRDTFVAPTSDRFSATSMNGSAGLRPQRQHNPSGQAVGRAPRKWCNPQASLPGHQRAGAGDVIQRIDVARSRLQSATEFGAPCPTRFVGNKSCNERGLSCGDAIMTTRSATLKDVDRFRHPFRRLGKGSGFTRGSAHSRPSIPRGGDRGRPHAHSGDAPRSHAEWCASALSAEALWRCGRFAARWCRYPSRRSVRGAAPRPGCSSKTSLTIGWWPSGRSRRRRRCGETSRPCC